MEFSSAETAACRRLVEMALDEDLGSKGDLTSEILIPQELEGKAALVARGPGVVAGLSAVGLVYSTGRTPLVRFEALLEDGTVVTPGQLLGRIGGLVQFILSGERTALNFLQKLSGIATLTRRYVDAVDGFHCQILDTRKTTPGWRLLEKYAVRCGGGHNHRMGLYDAMMIKDNHLAALGEGIKAFELVSQMLFRHFQQMDNLRPIVIEVDSIKLLPGAALCDADVIILDNISPHELREAVQIRNEVARRKRFLLEASGGVTLENVRAIAETGVDRISVGALTHSAPALDIALELEN
jgi:nicotinate-nucleotide pyrophosphorylase (carboxylating)